MLTAVFQDPWLHLLWMLYRLQVHSGFAEHKIQTQHRYENNTLLPNLIKFQILLKSGFKCCILFTISEILILIFTLRSKTYINNYSYLFVYCIYTIKMGHLHKNYWFRRPYSYNLRMCLDHSFNHVTLIVNNM